MIPEKCMNCIHHKTVNDKGDLQMVDNTDYCDYIEYFNNKGIPVPYPYFFKQEYPCKGYKEEEV